MQKPLSVKLVFNLKCLFISKIIKLSVENKKEILKLSYELFRQDKIT